MRTRRLAAFAVAAFTLPAVTAPAQAAAPTPKSARIVPVSSIGGVRIGQSYAEAHAAWGKGDDCSKRDAEYEQRTGAPLDTSAFRGSCYWFVKDAGEADAGQAGSGSVEFDAGKVIDVRLQSAQNERYAPIASGPMAKFKLPKGNVGLGASWKALFKAYPKLKRSGNGWQLTAGKRRLLFYEQLGRIDGVELR